MPNMLQQQVPGHIFQESVHKAKHPDFDTFSCPYCRTMASERRLYEAALARNPQHPLKNKMEQRLCL